MAQGKTFNTGRYATRLNAFRTASGRSHRPTVADMIAAAGKVGGLDAADLNFPDHFSDLSAGELVRILCDNGTVLYPHPAFNSVNPCSQRRGTNYHFPLQDLRGR